MTVIQKYPNGEAIELINGVRTWTAFKRRWFFNAFGTREDYTGLNMSSLQEAIDKKCQLIRFRLHNEKNNKLIGQWETTPEIFKALGVEHIQKKTGILTVNVPVTHLHKL